MFRPGPADRTGVHSPDTAASLVAPMLEGLDREHLLAVLLDTRHRLLAIVTISIGSIDRTFMSPREVFREALLHNASALVVAHNHPSGNPEPSTEDVICTRLLARGGEIMDIPMLDHIIVGAHGRWVSLDRRRVLQ